MVDCSDCAYSDRPTYKWPCSSCCVTGNGRSMYCKEDDITESKNINESYKNLADLIKAYIPIKKDATDTEIVYLLKEVVCKHYPVSRCKRYRYCCDCIYDAIKEKVGD